MIIKTVWMCLCVSAACVAMESSPQSDEGCVAMHQLKYRGADNSLEQHPGETRNQWLSRVMFAGGDRSEAQERSQQRRTWRARDRHLRRNSGKKYGQ